MQAPPFYYSLSDSYLFQVEAGEWFVGRRFFIMDGVVFLVVESDAFLVFWDTLVGEGFEQVHFFVNDDVVLQIGVVFVLEGEVVLRECLDGEVGSANGSFSGEDVGGFGNGSGCDVVDVWFVCFHDFYSKKDIL